MRNFEPWVDPDDAPEMEPDMFANATVRDGYRIIRRPRGRPNGSDKDRIAICGDRDEGLPVRRNTRP